MAIYFKMDSAIIEMGTAICGHHLRHPRELPVGEAVKRLPAATVYATFAGIGLQERQ